MKQNLMAYLEEYGGKSFQELPFSKADALILSVLSYLKYDGIVPGPGEEKSLGFGEIMKKEAFEQLFSDRVFGKRYRRFFFKTAKSRRFRQVRINFFQNEICRETELQFSAITFFLGESSAFLAFRGTDETLTGWKEDLNLPFVSALPSQKKALAYLLRVSRNIKGRLILGGHSKGGNLALYAAARAPENLQQRIMRIYSFDGPGFRREFYRKIGYLRIEDRYCKLIPADSLIGMLLENPKKPLIVESYGRGVLQHDVFNWKIIQGKFVYQRSLYVKAVKKINRINQWIDALSQKQAREFLEILYGLLLTLGLRDVYDLFRSPFSRLLALAQAFGRLDLKKRRIVIQVLGKLAKGSTDPAAAGSEEEAPGEPAEAYPDQK